MIDRSKLHEWATPLTIGAFALTGITGVLLFFKVNFGLIRPAHEWLSWLLVLGALLHVTVNWRATVQCASKPLGRRILIVFLLLICLSLVPVDDKHHPQPAAKIAKTLAQAPLQAVAQAANHEPDEVINMLRAKGLDIESKEQTISAIAGKNHRSPLEILELVF